MKTFQYSSSYSYIGFKVGVLGFSPGQRQTFLKISETDTAPTQGIEEICFSFLGSYCCPHLSASFLRLRSQRLLLTVLFIRSSSISVLSHLSTQSHSRGLCVKVTESPDRGHRVVKHRIRFAPPSCLEVGSLTKPEVHCWLNWLVSELPDSPSLFLPGLGSQTRPVIYGCAASTFPH